MMRSRGESMIILITFLLANCESSVISEKHATSNEHSNGNVMISDIYSEFIVEDKLPINIGATVSRKGRSVESQPWFVLKVLKQLRKVEDVLTVEEEEEPTTTEPTTQRETTLEYGSSDLTTPYIPQGTPFIEDTDEDLTSENNLNEKQTSTETRSIGESTTADLTVGTNAITTEDSFAHKVEAVKRKTGDVIKLDTNSNEEPTTEIFTTEESFGNEFPLDLEFTTENEEVGTTTIFTETEETTPSESSTTPQVFAEVGSTFYHSTEAETDGTNSVRTTEPATHEDLSEDIVPSTREELDTTTETLKYEETEPEFTTSTSSEALIGLESPGDDTFNLVVSILQYLERISHDLLEGIKTKNASEIQQFLHENPWLVPPTPKRRKRDLPESSCSSEAFPCPHEGSFRFNQSCTKYYECRSNPACNKTTSKLLKCPKCFKFNAQKGQCDLPENVPECTYSSLQQIYCTGPGQYFVPDDCQKYYDCQKSGNGTIDLIVKMCPSGMVFRPIEGRCVPGQKCKSRTPRCAPGTIYSVDRFSCGTFHYCMGANRTISMLCPTGFVFDGKFCNRWQESGLKKRLLKIQNSSTLARNL